MARVRKQPGIQRSIAAICTCCGVGAAAISRKLAGMFWQYQSCADGNWYGERSFYQHDGRQHPDINFIGVEVIEEVLLDAVKRMNAAAVFRKICAWYG